MKSPFPYQVPAAELNIKVTDVLAIDNPETRYNHIAEELEKTAQSVDLRQVESKATDYNITNIALGKTATQSKTDYGGVAERAIDGNTNQDYDEGKSISHTGKGDDNWWKLDLGSSYYIESIKIWNRQDLGSDRLAGKKLFVKGDDSTGESLLLDEFELSGESIQTFSIGKEARYISVEGDGIVSLAEVEVFGISEDTESTEIGVDDPPVVRFQYNGTLTATLSIPDSEHGDCNMGTYKIKSDKSSESASVDGCDSFHVLESNADFDFTVQLEYVIIEGKVSCDIVNQTLEIILENGLGVTEYDTSSVGWSEWPNLSQLEKDSISKCDDGCLLTIQHDVASESEGSKMSNARAVYEPDDSEEPKTLRTGPPEPNRNNDAYLKKLKITHEEVSIHTE